MSNTNRVENEVAAMSLVRQALAASKYRDIVPDIYSWGSTATGQGFTVQQYLPGTILDRPLKHLSLADKTIVFGQMAEILVLLQRFEVPKTINQFGGLKFDESGNVVSGQMSIYKGEPSATYKGFIRAIFGVKLQEADENPVIQGWTEKGVRTRLNRFLDVQLEKI